MYQSLYRRYRPQRFSDVAGQQVALDVLTRSVMAGRVTHAYLFSGPRGCGKTTVARLLAKAVNCAERQGFEPCGTCESCRAVTDGTSLDVREIDGASNNGVDEIRELKRLIGLASFGGRWKVYIIDEVHMLSQGAFNALLKTLEEPPAHVMFILATTELHKVPATIRSRCQHIPFHGMGLSQIVEQLRSVVAGEGAEAHDEALWEIARCSEGGMRDGLSLLEQCLVLGSGSITVETVQMLMGGGSSMELRRWLDLCRLSPSEAPAVLEGHFRSGVAPERLVNVLFSLLRNLWLCSRWGQKALQPLDLSDEERAWLAQGVAYVDCHRLEDLMACLSSLVPMIRRGVGPEMVWGLLSKWCIAALTPCDGAQPASPAPRVVELPVEPPAIPPVIKEEVEPPVFSQPQPELDFPGEEPLAAEELLPIEPEEEQPVGEAISDEALDAAWLSLVQSTFVDAPGLWAIVETVAHHVEHNKVVLTFEDSQVIAFETLRADRPLMDLRDRLQTLLPAMKHLVLRWNDEEVTDEGMVSVNLDSLDNFLPSVEEKPVKKEKPRHSEFQKPRAPQPSLSDDEDVSGDDAGTEPKRPSRSLLSVLSKLPEAELLYYRQSQEQEEETP